MILKSEGDEATKATHRQQLLQMVSYAENQFECRRKLMLRYFQEDFDPAQCHKTCDNCKARGGDGCGAERVDRAPLACKVLALLDQTRAKLTLGMLVDALKGSATTALRNKRATELPAFGSAKECWLGLGLGLGLG